MSLSVVVSTSLGIVIFGESTSLIKFLGILLILSAIISLNIKNGALEKNHLFGLLAGVLFGLAYTLDKKILFEIHPLIYIFWGFLFVALWGFVMSPKVVISSIKKLNIMTVKLITLSGLGYFAYNFSTFTAYRFGGEVGRVDAINNSQVFLIILFEYFVFKHKDGLLRKLLTAGVAFTGIAILGIF